MSRIKSVSIAVCAIAALLFVTYNLRVGDKDKVEAYIVANDPVVVEFKSVLSLPSYGISYFAYDSKCYFRASYIWPDGLKIDLDFRIDVSRWLGTAKALGNYNISIQNLARVVPSASREESYKVPMDQWKAFVASGGERSLLWTTP